MKKCITQNQNSVDLKKIPEFTEYLSTNIDINTIENTLLNEQKVGRSFLGFEREIKEGIKKSKNKKLAVKNLNFLLNAQKNRLSASKISSVLAISEIVNNNLSGVNYYKKHYGFEGGLITTDSLLKILKQKDNDEIVLSSLIEENEDLLPQKFMTDIIENEISIEV